MRWIRISVRDISRLKVRVSTSREIRNKQVVLNIRQAGTTTHLEVPGRHDRLESTPGDASPKPVDTSEFCVVCSDIRSGCLGGLVLCVRHEYEWISVRMSVVSG